MSLDSEDEVKRALGIDSWRNLSKGKVIRFAAMMPDMGKEVSMKIIEQFPKFKEFALDTLSVLEREHRSTLDSNAESQDQFHQIQRETLEILKGELDKDLTPEEKTRVFEHIKELGDKAFEKDSESKQFLDGLLQKMLLGAGVFVVAGLVFVGGKVMMENGGGDSIA